MARDKVVTNGSIPSSFLPSFWTGNSLQEGFLSKRVEKKKAQPLRLDGCGAVLDRAVPPRTLDKKLIGRGDWQRLYRERTNGRWGLMGVGSERGIAVLSRVEL